VIQLSVTYQQNRSGYRMSLNSSHLQHLTPHYVKVLTYIIYLFLYQKSDNWFIYFYH